MEIEKIEMPKEKAKSEWKAYNVLIKTRHDKYLTDMKKCMYELKEGKALIDIYKVMEKAGVNKKYQPKLAIARAAWKEVYFVKKDSGRGFFGKQDNNWANKSEGHIDLQSHTFMEWPRVHEDRETHGNKNTVKVETWQIANETIKTKVPIIPVQLMPEGKLEDYYILWEAFEWEELPRKDDPLLLKRITENLFVILAAWDVTDLEQSIISAR